MNTLAAAPIDPRAEGWAWWLILVLILLVVFVVVAALRRRFLKPMKHEPTDTTDAWVEAGRRLKVPPAPGDNGGGEADEESP